MMVNSAQPGEGGGGCTPSPITVSTITSKVVVYAPSERADTLLIFLLYPFSSLWFCVINCAIFVASSNNINRAGIKLDIKEMFFTPAVIFNMK
jgi:hypothetical protein